MKTFTKLLVSLALFFASIPAFAQNYTQHWWDPTKNGMGVPMHQQGQVIVGTWFMYEQSGQPSFLAFSGTLVKDSQNRDTLSSNLYRVTSSGGPSNYDPSRFSPSSVGTVLITFNSGSSATMQYNFSGQQGSIPLVPYQFALQGVVTKYTDYVIANWTGAYPFRVTKNSVYRMVNRTTVAGTAPFFNCWLASKQQTDGKIPISCQVAVTLARRIFYIDAATDEIREYSGEPPVDVVWRTVENNSDRPQWSAKAQVSDGWYFTPFDRTWVLMFQHNNGTITTIKEGNFTTDEVIRVMVSYTN